MGRVERGTRTLIATSPCHEPRYTDEKRPSRTAGNWIFSSSYGMSHSRSVCVICSTAQYTHSYVENTNTAHADTSPARALPIHRVQNMYSTVLEQYYSYIRIYTTQYIYVYISYICTRILLYCISNSHASLTTRRIKRCSDLVCSVRQYGANFTNLHLRVFTRRCTFSKSKRFYYIILYYIRVYIEINAVFPNLDYFYKNTV